MNINGNVASINAYKIEELTLVKKVKEVEVLKELSKVDTIKEQMKNGEYKVDLDLIAKSMVDELI